MSKNTKGYKVLPKYFRIIQGDGVDPESIRDDPLRAPQPRLLGVEPRASAWAAQPAEAQPRHAEVRLQVLGGDGRRQQREGLQGPCDRQRQSGARRGGSRSCRKAAGSVRSRGRSDDLLEPVFENGTILREASLAEVRAARHGRPPMTSRRSRGRRPGPDAGQGSSSPARGGGAGLPKLLCDIPGISSFFEGAELPYSAAAIQSFLGFAPEHFCSPEAAVDLAMQAYLRAETATPAIASSDAVSATLQPHRGAHRAHVAAMSDIGCRLHSLDLAKGSGPEQRAADGQTCDLLGLNALLEAAGCAPLPTGTAPSAEDAAELARNRLLRRPFFASDGRRLEAPP